MALNADLTQIISSRSNPIESPRLQCKAAETCSRREVQRMMACDTVICALRGMASVTMGSGSVWGACRSEEQEGALTAATSPPA